MTDTLKLKNGLVMPSNFIEVKDDEMEYVDGKKRVDEFSAFDVGRLFVGTALIGLSIPVAVLNLPAGIAMLCGGISVFLAAFNL